MLDLDQHGQSHEAINQYVAMADADIITPPDSGSGSESAASPPRWASAGDWEAYRGTITHLYEERGMSLDHVVQTMRDKHGFLATYASRERPLPPPREATRC